MEWNVTKAPRAETGKHILVVEDEDQVRILMQHVLLSAGYKVDAVASMAGALDRLATRSYDLVLTDDRLPDGRGVRIADIAIEKGIHAVVITGYMIQSAKADLDRLDHLMKPLRPEELVAAVDRHVARAH
jgi:CheY-like chemotaxis protein